MTFTEFLKDLCAFYPKDETAPGVHIAWLPDKDCFYASVHRFKDGLKSRKVVAKAMNSDMTQCLGDLRAEWLVQRETNS